MVSTYPIQLNGSAQASAEVPSTDPMLPDRCGLDPDDFTSGFAVWHGTSFAAPVFAAELCNALIAPSGSSTDASNPLNIVDVTTTKARVSAALATLLTVNGDVRR